MRPAERGVVVGLVLATLAACTSGPGERPLELPRGYLNRLEVNHDGQVYGFGPFVGYYFHPAAPGDFTRLRFLCFNERGFYASDAPANALLYDGEAVLAALPQAGVPVPPGPERIRPVFFEQAPAAWLASRPAPRDEFVHFHSLHDRTGPVPLGYWLRHVARASFTYDMGGRVGPGGPLYHPVTPGPDLSFARIVEFDAGPE